MIGDAYLDYKIDFNVVTVTDVLYCVCVCWHSIFAIAQFGSPQADHVSTRA